MKQFFVALAICSLFLYGFVALLHAGGYLHEFPTFFWQTLIFLNFATLLIFLYLIRSGRDSFIQLYLLTLVVKLLAYCAYNIVIILRDRENAGINVGFFMVTYLLFTTLELVFLYRRIDR